MGTTRIYYEDVHGERCRVEARRTPGRRPWGPWAELSQGMETWTLYSAAEAEAVRDALDLLLTHTED